MLSLLLATALGVSVSGNDTPLQAWILHSNSARTSVGLDVKYRERIERSTSSSEQSTEIPIANLPAALQGLSSAQLFSSGTRVHFRIVHDAGALDCQGWAHDGNASGDFNIVLNPQFGPELQRRGIGMPSRDEQRHLTLMGADYSYLDLLSGEHFERPSVSQFLRLLDHGVSAEYLREMAALRLAPRSIDGMVRASDHGVDPEYARSLIGAGYRSVSLDELIRARDHGVQSNMIAALKAQGYTGVPMSELIRLQDHGVTAQYIADLRRRGYVHLTLDNLIRLRDNGI